MGFGPMTSSLPKRCATPALRGPTLPSGLAPPRPNTLASGSCPLGPNPEATTLVIIAGFLHPRNRPGGWMLEVARRRNWRWPERPDPPTSRLRPLTSKMVGGGGFEPPKASPTDLQSAPFDRSGIPPKRRLEVRRWRFERYSEGRPSNFQLLTSRTWSRRWDSNPQPEVYKTPALPIELRRRMPDEEAPRKVSLGPGYTVIYSKVWTSDMSMHVRAHLSRWTPAKRGAPAWA